MLAEAVEYFIGFLEFKYMYNGRSEKELVCYVRKRLCVLKKNNCSIVLNNFSSCYHSYCTWKRAVEFEVADLSCSCYLLHKEVSQPYYSSYSFKSAQRLSFYRARIQILKIKLTRIPGETPSQMPSFDIPVLQMRNTEAEK